MTKLSESTLEEFVEKVEPTGSRVICNPPPMDTDEDFLVKLKPNVSLKFFEQQMQFEGFEGSSGDMYDLDETIFVSLRKEEANLIVTTNQDFFDKMVLATAVAKRLNVMKKSDRIMLFNAIVRGEAPRDSTKGLFGKTSGLTWYDDNPFLETATAGSNIAMGEFVAASEHAASVWNTLSVATQAPTVDWNPINTGHVVQGFPVPAGTTMTYVNQAGVPVEVTNNGTNIMYVNNLDETQPV